MVSKQHAFGQFEHEAAGVDAVFGNEPAQRSFEIDMAELHRREIDRDLEIGPAGRVHHRVVEHPLAERGKQPGVFGDGNEVRGRHLAMHGMAPAEQRLQADDLAGVAGDDRLIVQAEHVGFDRRAKVQFDGAAALDLLRHILGKQHRAVAAAILRLIERDVGMTHQDVGRLPVIRRERDADRGGDANALAVHDERSGERLGDTVCNRRARLVPRGRAENDEFIAAEARKKIVPAQAACRRSATSLIRWSPA